MSITSEQIVACYKKSGGLRDHLICLQIQDEQGSEGFEKLSKSIELIGVRIKVQNLTSQSPLKLIYPFAIFLFKLGQ